MDGLGEMFGGLFELYGERAVEATVDAVSGEPGAAPAVEYVRILAGARPILNVNDT